MDPALYIYQWKEAYCELICCYCVTGVCSQSEINMSIGTLTAVMCERSVSFSPAAQVEAETQPTAVM